jgi:hypothetical protein
MKSMKKKGNVEEVGNLALVFGSLAVILVVVFVILGSLETNTAVRTTGSKTDSNSFTAINATAVYFADYDSRGDPALSCSDVNIYNETTASNITSSVTISGCYATLSAIALNGTSPEVNYTMTFYEYSYGANASRDTSAALFGLVGWLPIIVVAFIGGIVLMLVIKSMTKE